MARGNSSIKCTRGFSLLELVVVFSVVGILFALAAQRYLDSVEQSQARVIDFQASAFMRSVENTRAISTLQGGSSVDLGEGVLVYLNAAGWPFASNSGGLPRPQRPTKSGCESLWRAFFREVHSNSHEKDKNVSEKFEISLIDNYICRYKLVRKQEGSYFFDYYLTTGSVLVSTPND